ncbi:hypothetical protein ACFSTC_23775 [Nonomuraea ferruginea]
MLSRIEAVEPLVGQEPPSLPAVGDQARGHRGRDGPARLGLAGAFLGEPAFLALVRGGRPDGPAAVEHRPRRGARLDLDDDPVPPAHSPGDHVDHQTDGVLGSDDRRGGPYVDLPDDGLVLGGGRRSGHAQRRRRERGEK